MPDTSADVEPYTLGDIRDLLQYLIDVAKYDEDRRRMNKGVYSDVSEFMSFHQWAVYANPDVKRLTVEAALQLPIYRRFLKAAKVDYNTDLDPTFFAALVADVLEASGIPLAVAWEMPLGEFEARWDGKKRKPKRTQSRTPRLSKQERKKRVKLYKDYLNSPLEKAVFVREMGFLNLGTEEKALVYLEACRKTKPGN